ncbi:Na(+)/H(+) exchanger protein 7-like [Centruroides vittatus]|uniref:Na(+)/H(+) exchanger protein 7-like n=1 Tax=Centruroides vittatus TaxID=120091 RepID=UPI0035103D02
MLHFKVLIVTLLTAAQVSANLTSFHLKDNLRAQVKSSDVNSSEGKIQVENDGNSKRDHSGGIHVATWRWDYVEDPFIYTTFVIIAGMCKIGFHHADFLSSIIPESCLLIMLGTAVGSIVYFTGSEVVPTFNSDTFFLYLLPPIVLDSAYSLHDRAFFSNLGTVLLYAVLGTLLNCFLIGPTLFGLWKVGAFHVLNLGAIECLIFSALISAVDPVAVLAIFQEVGVNKSLYFLVFGESLLNDAVTVVLYTMMVALATSDQITAEQIGLGVATFICVSFGALSIGIIMGLLTAIVTKYTTSVRVVEPLAVLGIAYLSYLLAEMIHFSGIISIIACGIVQAQYARRNISEKSSITVKYFSKMLSAICDTIIFLFLGMVLINDEHVWHTGFVFTAAALCFIYRFGSVFLLTYIANSLERVRPINMEEQFIMAYGGLRGAVAFSLVIMLKEDDVPNKKLFVTATLFIILFTVCIQGGTIKPLVSLLKIRRQSGKTTSLFTEINNKVVDNITVGIEEITGDHGDNTWMQRLYRYNNQYIKSWLLKSSVDDKLTRIYTKMVLEDHYAHLYGPATVIEENRPLPTFIGSDYCEIAKLDLGEEENEMMIKADDDEKKPLRLEEESSVENTAPANDLNKRRHTVINMLAPSLRRKQPQEDNTSELLKKALLHNPYNKYHQKYNPNLVGEEEQELSTHLRARRIRARRLTLAALHSCSATEEEDIPEEQMEKPEVQPRVQSELYSSPTNKLLEKAYRRRSLMSSKRPRLERAKTIFADTQAENAEEQPLVRQKPKSVNLGTISEENGDAQPSDIVQSQSQKRVRLQKSITIDTSPENDETTI